MFIISIGAREILSVKILLSKFSQKKRKICIRFLFFYFYLRLSHFQMLFIVLHNELLTSVFCLFCRQKWSVTIWDWEMCACLTNCPLPTVQTYSRTAYASICFYLYEWYDTCVMLYDIITLKWMRCMINLPYKFQRLILFNANRNGNKLLPNTIAESGWE